MANKYDLPWAGGKRVGNPYASKVPSNQLDDILDHYFGDDGDFNYRYLNGYVDPVSNHEDPKADLI